MLAAKAKTNFLIEKTGLPLAVTLVIVTLLAILKQFVNKNPAYSTKNLVTVTIFG